MQNKRRAWRSFLFFLLIGIAAVLFLFPIILEQVDAQIDELGITVGLPIEFLAAFH